MGTLRAVVANLTDLQYWAVGLLGLAIGWGLLGLYGAFFFSGGSKAFAQNQLLVGWIGLYAVSFFLFYHKLSFYAGLGKRPGKEILASAFTSPGGWAAILAVLVGALMLGAWLWEGPSHKAPVIFKVLAQVALLTLVMVIMFKFWEWMGGTVLPHIMGVHMDEGWVRGIPRVFTQATWWVWPGQFSLLPVLLNLFLALCVFVSGYVLGTSFISYGPRGIISTQGLIALLAFFFLLGPAWEYRKTMNKWRDGYDEVKKRGARLQPPPGDDAGDIVTSESVRLAELRYGTREANLLTFHRLPDDRHGLAYAFPGFLIGVEKASRYLIDVREPPKAHRDAALKAGIKRLLDDRKRTFISHIVEFRHHEDSLQSGNIEARFIHNLYALQRGDRDSAYADAYTRGFLELDSLQMALERRLKGGAYTHILVFCMGWNTDQQESIRNFNSLRGYLDDAERASPGPKFNPLFIGISWPSQWAGLAPLSYPAKADDADETGLVWGGYLVKKVLAEVKSRYPLVKVALVGHSFGARVLTRALASDPAWSYAGKQGEGFVLSDSAARWAGKTVDLFVGLQGAVGADLFVEKGVITGGNWQGAPYKDLPATGTRFLYTWSKHDKANPVAAYVTGANLIGGRFGAYLAEDHAHIFRSLANDGKGWSDSTGVDAPPRNDPRFKDWLIGQLGPDAAAARKVGMVDVSDFVQFHPYGKGGKAHSDIYKGEIGNLVWDALRTLP